MFEDKLLILRLRRGCGDAFERVYEKYRLYLLKIAAGLCDDVSDAEDVVHDVFIRLAQRAEAMKVDGSLKAYLRVCVVNGVRNRVRGQKVRSYVELSEAGAVVSDQCRADQWVMLKEESQMVHAALKQLPFEQREVIVLHLHGDMKFRQIAGLQEASTKTIQSRYRYGLDKLRSILSCEVQK